MRRSPCTVPLLFSLLVACGGPSPAPTTPATPPSPSTATATVTPPAPAASKPPPETLAADTPRATAAGATFTVPAGWTIEADGPRVLLSPPEGDMKLGILDTTAKTADEAVAAAWEAVHPGFKRVMKLTTPRPGRHGWDERRDYDYETSPNEKLNIGAIALRHGEAWTVLTLESSDATFEKRGAGFRVALQSLRSAGYTPESFAGKTARPLDADRLKAITDFVEHGRDALAIPGVAIALVQGDKVLYQGGFGVRELGKPAKVDADTKFLIASNTKALTTLLLAKEVDEGRFSWDTPVSRVYPAFKLGDADTTGKVLMKHLICACTGMPRQDLEWIFEYKNATPKSEIGVLSTFQPTTKFGEAFQYSNLMAAVAGFIGGHEEYPNKELGAAYDEAMQTRVFGPLGMSGTTFDFARALREDHATPHSPDIDGKMSLASAEINHAIIPLRPAGGAWSSVKDMIKYVTMELDKGKLPNGKTYVSEGALLARRVPQVPLGAHATYGMGLMVDTETGVPLVHHGGDLTGMHSDMFWLPEQGVGGVILTNADGGASLRAPFIRKVLEELFDGKPQAEDDLAAAATARKAQQAEERTKLVVPPEATAVAQLAARYRNAALGDITVKKDGASVIFDFDEWTSRMASRVNDDGTISFATMDPGLDGISFVVATRDGKRALVIRDSQHEYVFSETP